MLARKLHDAQLVRVERDMRLLRSSQPLVQLLTAPEARRRRWRRKLLVEIVCVVKRGWGRWDRWRWRVGGRQR